MKNLSEKLQKLIVWLTGYLNVIAFFIAGGYVYLNTDSEDVKTSSKTVLYLVAGFTGLEILRSIIYNILSLADVEYVTLSAVNDVALVLNIIKAIVFVTLFILDLCSIKIIPIKTTAKNKFME